MPKPFISDAEEVTEELVAEFIDKHRALIPRYEKLRDMYESNHDILTQDDKPDYKPDNRLVANFAKYCVDTLNGYLIGKPIKTTHPDEKISELVNKILKRNDQDDNNAELSKICSIFGHGFEFLYQDEEADTWTIYGDPLDTFIVYDNTVAQKPFFAVRYHDTEEDGIKGTVYTKAVEYTFLESGNGIMFVDVEERFYNDVPVIEWIENEERTSIFEPVGSLINAYNKAISEKANDVDYFADAYLAVLGAELDETGIHRIRDNRVINLFGTDDASKIIVKFLEKPNADEAQENLIDRLEKLIYQMAMIANISDESFGTSTSGVALGYKLQNMENLALMKQRKITSAMNKRWKMIFYVLSIRHNVNKDEWYNLEHTFSRNIPKNALEESETASNLQGVVSKETQLKVLSVVSDVQAEIKKMKEEEGDGGYGVDENGDFVVNS